MRADLSRYAHQCERHLSAALARDTTTLPALYQHEKDSWLSTATMPRNGSQWLVPAHRLGVGRLAVLLRGFVSRLGDAGSTRIARSLDEGQVEAMASLERRLIAPFEALGAVVDLHLTVYDSLGPGHVEELIRSVRSRVRTITRVRSRDSNQLLTVVVALRALEQYLDSHSAYDAVILTRFDLRYKVDLAPLLARPRELTGFRFWFREKTGGGAWRDIKDEQEALGVRIRNEAWRPPRNWRSVGTHARVPDTLIAFPGALLRCFTAAVRRHVSKGWPSGVNNCSLVSEAALPRPCRPSQMQRVMHHIWKELGPALDWRGAGVEPGPQPAPDGHIKLFDFIVPDAAFDSNPCRAKCMLNPAYEIMSRDLHLVKAGVCQTAADFSVDAETRSVCCPSFSYCCPHSVSSCADPRAQLLTMSHIDDAREDAIAQGWWTHFVGRGWAACPVRSWNNWTTGAGRRRRCASALSDDMLLKVIRIWEKRHGREGAKRGYWIPPDEQERWAGLLRHYTLYDS